MADLNLRARTPLEGLASSGRFGAATHGPGLVIEERTDLALATVIARRGAEQALNHAVAAVYGIELSERPRAIAKDGVSFLGTGPRQWFAIAEGHIVLDFVRSLREHLRAIASISDQSDGRVVLHLSGKRIGDVLAKGIPVDLHPRSFKTGDVASTLVAHIGVQIQKLDDSPTFQLMAFRSFSGSLLSWLTQSSAEFGYEIVRPRS